MPRGSFTLLILLFFVVTTFGRRLVLLVTDAWWFEAIGHGGIFWTMFTTQAIIGTGALALLSAVLVGNVNWALGTTRNRPFVLATGSPLATWAQDPQRVARTARIAAFVIAALLALGATAWWAELLLWWNAEPFGETDPVFDMDAGFYVFTLPLLDAARLVLIPTMGLAFALSLGVYLAKGALTLVPSPGDAPPALRADPKARRHLASLAAVGLLLIAMSIMLDRFAMIYDAGGLTQGPGYTAIRATLPLMTVQAAVTAISAFLVFTAIDQLRGGPLFGAVLFSGLSAIATAFVPGTVQQFFVDPNEFDRESAYIAEHVQATRRGWGLSDVEERSLSGNAPLTWDQVEDNQTTIQSIRLWDHGPLLETFRQVQEIRTYYDFAAVDNDRYMIEGRLRQTMISPRELQPESLPTQARTWLNETLVYTHGYGVAMGPVNEITEDGLPRLWVKDLPPEVTYEDPLRIDQPAIYFGERMTNPVIVRTKAKEFDFPTSDGNAYSRYEGKSGLPIGNFGRKLFAALRFGDVNILLSDDLEPDSRVLMHRPIPERVRQVAPFLHVDRDPYLVIADGRLVWVVEGYTASGRYPYSSPRTLFFGTERVRTNYVRNSVKIVVDAYDGTVEFYRTTDDDPILAAFARAFPGTFKRLNDMPAALRDHLRYPSLLFEVQANLFTAYHMTNTRIFYNREDEWEVPAPSGSARMEPYYTVMRLPKETDEEFILMLPFTPRNRDNLSAWMVARSDGEHYGKLRVYRFPKDRLVYGPSQVVARIQQNDRISERLTLWNQQSSRAPLGTLLVIPIDQSLLYVQPLYLRANRDAIPELKRVIVGFEDQITMQPTLDQGLRVLFGDAKEPARSGFGFARSEATMADPVAALPEGMRALANEARDRYVRMAQAAQVGDWTGFGQALEDLGRALEALGEVASIDPEAPDMDQVLDALDQIAPPSEDAAPQPTPDADLPMIERTTPPLDAED